MKVTKQHIETFKAAFYNNTADETADPVEIALAAVFATLAPDLSGGFVPDRQCKACGITTIEPGTTIDGELLCWNDDDLCSRCADDLQEALDRDAGRYRHLRNRQTRQIDIATGGIFVGMIPQHVILGGEDLDRAIDAEKGLALSEVPTLERRLAECLAKCIDTPVLTGRDECGGYSSPLDIRLGFFQPELTELAATLLEEAGV